MFSTRFRYGLRAAVELALAGAWRRPGARPAPLAEVASRQGISERYLRQIFMALRRAGIVVASRGRGGGYLLARAPSAISARDVARAVGERLEPVGCTARPRVCPRRRECPTYPLWCSVAEDLEARLESASVEDLAARCPARARRRVPAGHDFCI